MTDDEIRRDAHAINQEHEFVVEELLAWEMARAAHKVVHGDSEAFRAMRDEIYRKAPDRITLNPRLFVRNFGRELMRLGSTGD